LSIWHSVIAIVYNIYNNRGKSPAKRLFSEIHQLIIPAPQFDAFALICTVSVKSQERYTGGGDGWGKSIYG